MDLALKISGFIGVILFIILAIVAIFVFLRVGGILGEAQKAIGNVSETIVMLKNRLMVTLDEVSDLQRALQVTLRDIGEIKDSTIIALREVSELSDQIENTLARTEQRAESVFRIFDPMKDLVNSVYYKIAPPVMNTASVISASGKAINTFMGFFKKKNS
ncbi:MAG: hypothetical protein ACM3U1_11390 [Chloroflexota bacterium]